MLGLLQTLTFYKTLQMFRFLGSLYSSILLLKCSDYWFFIFYSQNVKYMTNVHSTLFSEFFIQMLR